MSYYKRFPRFTTYAFYRDKFRFLSEEHGRLYEWDIGFIMYLIRKVHLLNTRHSIIHLFEYLMTVPALLASNREIRDVTIAKINDIHFPDYEWIHLRQSMIGFIDDLIFHPLYTP